MAKIIALFNNKGGVSKTTTTFHLGWILAEMGHKTLIVDTDPQCNLTGLCIGLGKKDKLNNLYRNKEYDNIKDILSPVFDGRPEPLKAANCYCFERNNNLFLLPGHIEFSEYDASYNIAENLTGSLKLLQNIPGALSEVLKLTIKQYDIKYVLLDMSPSISSTNANILMQSDYFFVPCAPDYFCYMAIESLIKVFPRWNDAYSKIRENEIFKNATYKIKSSPPQFIGTIQQRYRPRNSSPSKAFSEWISDINNLVKDKLIPVLNNINMAVQFNSHNYEEQYNLINIADFNSLIAYSQICNTPVFLLTQDQVGKTGKVWENMQQNRDDFQQIFKTLASRLINVTQSNG